MVDDDLPVEKIRQLPVKVKRLALKPQVGWLCLRQARLCEQCSSGEVRRVWGRECTEPAEPGEVTSVIPKGPCGRKFQLHLHKSHLRRVLEKQHPPPPLKQQVNLGWGGGLGKDLMGQERRKFSDPEAVAWAHK